LVFDQAKGRKRFFLKKEAKTFELDGLIWINPVAGPNTIA
jgi:hypothetical protein